MVKMHRCEWCGADPLYVAYHDEEWGVPVGDERGLFERLSLEGMQTGLSWLTVLKKRERMKQRFFDFDAGRLAEQDDAAVASWLQDAGLIRHRGKLTSLVGNARALFDLDGGLAQFVWPFVNGAPKRNRWRSMTEVPSTSAESEAMSNALKSAGFRFVGPTVCYAFMQSAGLVNDHVVQCHRWQTCADLGSAWGT